MKCQYFIINPRYGKPAPCSNRGAKTVRWAPSPLTTKIYRLCPAHKAMLERGRLKP